MIDDVLLPKLVNNAQSVQMKMEYSDDRPGLLSELGSEYFGIASFPKFALCDPTFTGQPPNLQGRIKWNFVL
jgi:hypothetical protein